jgi:uncharacterized protein YjiS (DUF1127 family)
MSASPTGSRAATRRIPRHARLTNSGKSGPARSGTTVAAISCAGMMPQHAHDRLFRANNPWERSMQFGNQSSGQRSALAAHRGVTITPLSRRFLPPTTAVAFAGQSAGSRPDIHAYRQIDPWRTEGCRGGEGRSIRTRLEPDRSWRVISAALFGVSARFVGGFAACGEIAISGFLLAFMSWTMAQVLAGCAAYGQAMHPCVIEDDTRERRDSGASAPDEPTPLPRTHEQRFCLESIVRSKTQRVDPPVWGAPIAPPWRKLRSRMCRAVAELRTLDDRSPRDLQLPRRDIEQIGRHGDRCQ